MRFVFKKMYIMLLDEKKKIAKRQKIYRKNNCTSIINKLNHATVELDNKIRSVPACNDNIDDLSKKNDNIDDNKLSVQAWHLPFLLAA